MARGKRVGTVESAIYGDSTPLPGEECSCEKYQNLSWGLTQAFTQPLDYVLSTVLGEWVC